MADKIRDAEEDRRVPKVSGIESRTTTRATARRISYGGFIGQKRRQTFCHSFKCLAVLNWTVTLVPQTIRPLQFIPRVLALLYKVFDQPQKLYSSSEIHSTKNDIN